MEPDNIPRVERGLSDILAESTYMTSLISDLLTLARSGAEDASIPMELLELNDSVRAIVDRAKAQAATRDISLEYISHGHVVPLSGNQNMIERILMILIDNAVRYSSPKGKIWVETWVTAEQCGFVVRDNGIGIARAIMNVSSKGSTGWILHVPHATVDTGWASRLRKVLSRSTMGPFMLIVNWVEEQASDVTFLRADVLHPAIESQPVH